MEKSSKWMSKGYQTSKGCETARKKKQTFKTRRRAKTNLYSTTIKLTLLQTSKV